MKSNVYRSEGVRGEWNLGKLVLVCKRQGHHSRALRSYFRLGKDLRRSLPADDVHTTTRWPQLRSDETCVALDECLAVDNRQKVLPSSQPPHEKKGPAEAIAHEVIVVVTNPCRSPRHLAKYFSLVSAKIARWRHEGETPLLLLSSQTTFIKWRHFNSHLSHTRQSSWCWSCSSDVWEHTNK